MLKKSRVLKQQKKCQRILHESETNAFNSIATGNESWFQHTTASSEMFAHSAADVIPRMRQAVVPQKNMITALFTTKKLIVLDVLPRGSTFKQLYFINDIFPDLKTANPNFRRQKTGPPFWVHMNNSGCHNGSKVRSTIKRTTFPECRTRPINQIESRATVGSLGC
jgi:hypothetical protein